MRIVTVRALKNFDSWEVGDEFQAVMNERLANLIVNGYLLLVYDPGVTDDARSDQ